MKIAKTVLQGMLIAITAGMISSCEKPTVDNAKKPETQTPKTSAAPQDCPGCGMG